MTGRCPTCNQPLPDTNAQRRDPPLPPPYDGFSNDAETVRERQYLDKHERVRGSGRAPLQAGCR